MESFKLLKNPAPKARKTYFHILLDHFLAILLAVIGYIIALLIGAEFVRAPLLIFLPMIALSAWNGGLSSGILTSTLAALLINYYLYPGSAQNFYDPPRALQSILLIIQGSALSFIIQTLMRQERITEYKQRERALNRKIFELEEKNKAYEKEIRSRDEFLSIASHELKTPLTSMLLQTQTALHNIRNVSVAQFSFENLLKMLESVENQTKRLSKMINDLLAVSVITVGNLNLEYEEIDLNELVKGVITDFAARIEKDNYVVSFNPTGKIVGSWDKIRIEQAVSNFVSNAIKYGNQKPIEIETKNNSLNAEFTIKDNGIGMNKQQQKRIFELFERSVSPDKYKGLGVGLYITQKIIDAHGGSVNVSSNPGHGSQFTMKIPLKRPTKLLQVGPPPTH